MSWYPKVGDLEALIFHPLAARDIHALDGSDLCVAVLLALGWKVMGSKCLWDMPGGFPAMSPPPDYHRDLNAAITLTQDPEWGGGWALRAGEGPAVITYDEYEMLDVARCHTHPTVAENLCVAICRAYLLAKHKVLHA